MEPLEKKRPLSASASTAPLANALAATHTAAARPAEARANHRGEVAAARRAAANSKTDGDVSAATLPMKPNHGFLVYRITNPNRFNNKLTPPFSHVLVQDTQPVRGQVYNVLYIAVRNGTAQTFDASAGFAVRFPAQKHATPILTGDQLWKPGQEFVFYVLTKKYYPIQNQVTSGFEFNLGNARSVAIPGPSGIFLRVKYDPATFPRTLDWIVAFGPGAQGGKGIKFGLPDTAIYEFVSAKTDRSDFGGYF
jgi:hypothetical protein